MTREEARIELQAMKDTFEEYEPGGSRSQMALDIALAALRPVSREQVERVWRGEWLHDPETGYEHCDKCSHTISLDDYLNRKPPLFCEMCGAPMTDEAVQMVMERMEKLYETI